MSNFLAAFPPDIYRRVAAFSYFVTDWIARYPEAVDAAIRQGQLAEDGNALTEDVSKLHGDDAPDFMRALRSYRNSGLAIIAIRDLCGFDTFDETLAQLSTLADRCIEAALHHAEARVAERYGVLRDAAGEPIRLIVIGMGKLGGFELNFSSDIDLIFAYRERGLSDGERELDADGYCRRVAQTMVQTLAEATVDGFVYRVDTRLRPFGDAGALVAPISAMEQYYQANGREWERYAWVKARAVAGDIVGGHRLIETLRPFVYRRYLDYGTFESIRDMKAMIDRQVARKESQANIKLGAGGIREVEFIVQAFQLIRGGQEPELQDNRLRPTLARLAEAGHIPAHTSRALDAAYVFLRRAENRLQMVDDRQTHDLPVDDGQRGRIARAMNYDTLDAFDQAMQDTRRSAQEIFEQVFVSPQAEATHGGHDDERLAALWQGQYDAQQSADLLADYEIHDAEAVMEAFEALRDQRLYRTLEKRGRRWIARLVPLMVAAASHSGQPDGALLRTLSVVSAVIGRSNYIALLVEHPAALATLMRLCGASEWITVCIQEQPALLDSLLDPRQLYRPPGRREMTAALEEDLSAIDADDLEQRMDALRRFKQAAVLRIAAADVTHAMPLMIVSDHLTDLAEVSLDAALDIAWHQMTSRYGTPRDADGQRAPFTVIAYGKLGGLELGYTSDLDLVFLYAGDTEKMTDGKRELTHQAFFTRLSQRLIHVLSTQTAAGRVYEIDMRLRPSGRAGMMVSPVDAFERYQREQAWTWEHQALVRARYVGGDLRLGEKFGEVRRGILSTPRDAAQLAKDVCDMRERMRGAKDESSGDRLDVKQMAGGLIDIEFIAQFAALRYGPECPELLIFTDAIRILETLESAGMASYEDIKTLTDAYRKYRRSIHAQALQQQRAMIGADEWHGPRDAVAVIWQDWLKDESSVPAH